MGRLALGLLLALHAAPSIALAQDADTDEARGAFQAGEAAYRAGRFDDALSYFRRAYELTNEPDVLYNIATVLDRLRRDQEALDAYRRYLDARPDSADRANIEARISVLERSIARDSAEATAEAPAAPARSTGDDAERTLEASPASTASDPGPAPWIVSGIGAALLIAGVGLLIGAQVDTDAVSSGTRWAEIREPLERAPILFATGMTSLALGLAALGAGLAWGLLSGGSGGAEVAIGPGGLRLRGWF